jgi:hypothetical protein
MTTPCQVDPVIVDENSFFNWLNSDNKTCPTPENVFQQLIENIGTNTNLSTDIYNSEVEIASLTKVLDARKLDVEVAKDRATMAQRPEMTASYYDSWFPIGRPLKRSSVPILIGFATFFLTMGFFTLLELFGITNAFSVYVPFEKTPSLNPLRRPLFIMSGIAILFFCVTVYLFIRG